MKTIRALIERHPVLSYYALAFAISWGGVLMVVGPGKIPATNKEQFDTLFPIAILLMVGIFYAALRASRPLGWVPTIVYGT